MAEISNNGLAMLFILTIILVATTSLIGPLLTAPEPIQPTQNCTLENDEIGPTQPTVPPSPVEPNARFNSTLTERDLGDDQELTTDRVDFIKGNLVSLVKDTYCYNNRLDDLTKPADQFLEFTREPTISTHWGQSEFQLETNYELIRIGKVLERQTHRLRFDAITEQITHCDEPVLFNYSLYPVLDEQESPKNW